MNIADINKELSKINKFLSKCAWLDFGFGKISMELTELYGGTDAYFDNYESIKIEFHNVSRIKTSLYDIEIPKDKPFVELASEEETKNALDFVSDKGSYSFKLNAENDVPVWIIAETIKCTVLKPIH